ncbi:transposase [Sphingobium phage Lacusarx]|uniref:Transposase n=1 Tax=Sphingobium phage Lacusarx TaxID=1980139 RepID=A0A1W6DX49_9CAUD|nr:RIIB lysis inhibitor [Sphingobium phage Lacusarx]ARK07475.1 transposase [Sphingobium phage Lacusarx]
MLSFTLGASSITVFLDGVFNTIDTSHANHPFLLAELQKAPADRDLEAIRTYITIKSLIEHLSIGKVTVFEDEIHYDGQQVHGYLAERMLEILNQRIDLTPWATFMDNVHLNPANYAKEELYQWLEKAKMPLTPDGCFLAFKKVRQNYTDCHSGMFDNSPGTILEMDRDACDPKRDNTCSTGFHFCSIGYIGNFGGERVVVVKINPKDVTSIPSDYGFTKGRCCRYEVVAELSGQSAAYHQCWRKTVVNLEDPAEFPAGVLSMIKLPDAAVDAPLVAAPDPVFVTEDRIYHPQTSRAGTLSYVADGLAWVFVDGRPVDSVKVTFPVEEIRHLEDDDAISIEHGAPGLIRYYGLPSFSIDNVSLTIPDDHEELQQDSVVGFDFDPVFTTADGREFKAVDIKTALEGVSIRAAARSLGIQDSTLRGWKKKLGL